MARTRQFPTKPRGPGAFRTSKEMAEVFDVTQQAFNKIKKHALPGSEKAPAKKGGAPTWWGRGLIAGWVNHQNKLAIEQDRKTRKTDAAAEVEAGAIARTRALNQELLELKLATQKGELVPVQEVRDSLSGLSEILRQCFDAIMREGGIECYRILEESLDEYDERINGTFGESKANDNGKSKKKTKAKRKAGSRKTKSLRRA